MKKRIKVLMLVIVMLFCMIMPVNHVQAATGKTTLAVSAGTLDIGDTVKITAKAVSASGGNAYATMTLSYDASILQFVSCSTTYGGGNGNISVSIDKFTVELKAIAAGKCPVYLSATDGVDFSSGEELASMEGTSTNITVNNAASNNGGGTGSTGSTNNGNGTGSTGSTNNGNATGSTGSTNNGNGTGSTGSSNSGNTTGSTGSTNSGNTTGSTGSSNNGDATGNAGTSNNGGNTNTEVKLSADNSLKSLTISPGTLSPAFKGSTVNYTASVANDVTNVAVNAVVANTKATVESVTGNTDLKVGQNAIKIVVKAENGTTATYTIKVTRADAGASLPSNSETQKPDSEVQNPDSEAQNPDSEAQNPSGTGMIMFDNSSYEVVKEIPAEVIPKDFSKAVVNYQGIEHQGLEFEKGTLSLLYLKKTGSADQEGRFVIYDETRNTLYPFVRLENGNNYVIALMAPVDTEVPDTYTNTSFSAGSSETVSAFQLISEEEAAKEFYLFYGVNQEGNEGWYQYDSVEEIYQRTLNGFSAGNSTVSGKYEYLENEYSKLKETYQKEKTFSRNVIYILILVIAILLILLINIFRFFRKKTVADIDSLDMGEDILEEVKEPAKKKKRKKNRKKAEQEDGEIFDFNDED